MGFFKGTLIFANPHMASATSKLAYSDLIHVVLSVAESNLSQPNMSKSKSQTPKDPKLQSLLMPDILNPG